MMLDINGNQEQYCFLLTFLPIVGRSVLSNKSFLSCGIQKDHNDDIIKAGYFPKFAPGYPRMTLSFPEFPSRSGKKILVFSGADRGSSNQPIFKTI